MGTTQSVRYLGQELHRRFGFTVSGPRLAGHGTSPDDMATTGYLDWMSSCEQALHELAADDRPVFVTGLSMGGTLAHNLAARFSAIVAGIVPINSPVGILEPPLAELVMSPSAPARVPGRILESVGSDDVRLLWLNDSYHVATPDHDKDRIVQRAGSFIEEIGGREGWQ